SGEEAPQGLAPTSRSRGTRRRRRRPHGQTTGDGSLSFTVRTHTTKLRRGLRRIDAIYRALLAGNSSALTPPVKVSQRCRQLSSSHRFNRPRDTEVVISRRGIGLKDGELRGFPDQGEI